MTQYTTRPAGVHHRVRSALTALVNTYRKTGAADYHQPKAVRLGIDALRLIEDLPYEDHSQTNPALHQLHVYDAQQDLEIIDEFISRLEELRRVDMTILAGVVREERGRLLRCKASYREALWRLAADAELFPQDLDEVGTDLELEA